MGPCVQAKAGKLLCRPYYLVHTHVIHTGVPLNAERHIFRCGVYLRHVSHHLPWHVMTRERRGLPQHSNVTPRDFQRTHDAFQKCGLPTSTGPQQAITATQNQEHFCFLKIKLARSQCSFQSSCLFIIGILDSNTPSEL